MLALFTFIPVTLYAIASFLQWQIIQGRSQQPRYTNQLLGFSAFIVQALSIYGFINQEVGINLELSSIAALIAWLVVGLVLLSSLRQNISDLFIGVFPLAAITTLLAWVAHPSTGKVYPVGVIAHILLSILAYSIFTIAALQAILLAKQEAALKQHHTRGLIASLPPLQTMERLLFEMIWAGLALLSTSLISGFIYVEDLFAQHLVHKTALSILAWLFYATLLFGRLQFGWRSHTAVRWTVAGFVILALGFFGSKAVLEFLL